MRWSCAAGGAMTAPDGSALRYGQRTTGYRVPGFVAWGDPRRRGYCVTLLGRSLL